jgi:hypothetical protein
MVLLAVIVVPLVGTGQTVEKERTVSRSFVLNESTEIEVTNKYGDIHLVPWEKDSVRFDIRLLVKSTKQSKLDKTFDFIDFNFKANDYYIIAQTVFEQGGSFWSEVNYIANNLFSAGTTTSIDYTIHLPVNAHISLQHKYGNIYMTDFTGDLNVDLSNGNLKAHDLCGEIMLKVNFGDLDVQSVKKGQIDLSYGELHLDEADEIRLNASSASIYSDQIRQLALDAKRSKLYLEKVGNINGTTYFTTIELDDLSELMTLNTRYGSVDIKNIGQKVSMINLITYETDLTLTLNPKDTYGLDLLVNDKTEVLYSAKITNIDTQDKPAGDKKIQVKYTIGDKKHKAIPLKLSCEAGRVSLKMK